MTSSDLSAFEAEVHNFIGEHLHRILTRQRLGFGISRADGERWHKAVYNQWIAPDWPVERRLWTEPATKTNFSTALLGRR